MASHPRGGISPGLTFLFAVSGGAAVANNYWAQPLLSGISQAFGVSAAAASTLVTVTQLGYAAGVFMLVPLGDTLSRQRMIPIIMILSSLALAASAIAPSYPILLACFAAVGVTSVPGQLLVPMAGDLATDAQRGRVIGSIASGMLTGILLSRTVSGVIGDLLGWRAVYVFAAAVMLVLAILQALCLPREQSRSVIPYRALLASVASVVRRHAAVRVTLVICACTMSVFSTFWTSLTFLLSAPPFSYSVTQIGLVGLAGLAGALAARGAGRLHDRGWSTRASGATLTLQLLSVALALAGGGSIMILLGAVLLIDIAIQGTMVLGQTRLLSIEPTSRSRLNTAFVTANFLGAAAGSALAGVLWQHGGWRSVLAGAAALTIVALLVWLFGRHVLTDVEHASDRRQPHHR